jgi:hypothetical protein
VNEFGHSLWLLTPAKLLNVVENDLITGLSIESQLVGASKNTFRVVSRLIDLARSRAIRAGVVSATNRELALSSVVCPLFPEEEVIDGTFAPSTVMNSADLEVASNLIGILYIDVKAILNHVNRTNCIGSLCRTKH